MLFERGNAGTDRDAVKRIAREVDISVQVADILVSRGIDTLEAAKAFLSPGELGDPFALAGVKEACDVIEETLSEDAPITIFGDYDCDGISASAILYETLTALGADVTCMLPNRELDGYGLNKKSVEEAIGRGGLLITVDCGITNIEEAQLAHEGGLKIIITDHHRPVEQIPVHDALINPHVSGEEQYKCLCGAGVAFKLSQALLEEDALELLDICALATIADIVPLMGENRTIVKMGLDIINKTPREGIAALISAAGLDGKEINAGKIAYTIAPRINSAGRMGDAMRGLELLISDSSERIEELAAELNNANTDRQLEEESIVEEARHQAAGQCPERLTLVIASEGWHPGVIGIVASRMVERYNRPSVVISIDGEGVCTGSARGITGTHIFEALNSCEDILLRYGGHEMAGGFSLHSDYLDQFKERFEDFFRQKYSPDVWLKRVIYDAETAPKDITLKLARELNLLAPFGCGNPSPTVLMSGVTVKAPSSIGRDNNHQRMSFARDGKTCEAVSFGKGGDYMQEGVRYDVIASVDVNEWNGVSKPQCVLRERRFAVEGFEQYPEQKLAYFGYSFIRSLENSGGKALPVYEDMSQYACGKLEECVFGRVVVCHTPRAARTLLNAMKERRLLEGSNIYVGHAEPHQSLENIIILAPDNDAIYGGYSDIIYIDGVIPPMDMERCFAPAKTKATQVYAKYLFMEREGMATAYKALLMQAKRRYLSFGSMIRAASQISSIEEDRMGMAFHVFEKLGFIAFDNGMVTVNKVEKRELEENKGYSMLMQQARG